MLKNDSGGDEGGYKGFIIDLMDEITKDMADVDYQGRDLTTFIMYSTADHRCIQCSNVMSTI